MYYYGNMYNWGQQFNKLYWIQQQINDIELRQGNMDFAQTIGYKGSFEQYKYSFSRQKYDAKWYANTESETRLLYDAYKTIQGMREQITGQKINYRLYASLGRGQERHIGYVEVAGDNLHKFITQEATALRINESAVRKAIRQKENEMKIAKAGFASMQRTSDIMRYDKSTEAINKIYSGLLGQNIIQSQETAYTYTKKDGSQGRGTMRSLVYKGVSTNQGEVLESIDKLVFESSGRLNRAIYSAGVDNFVNHSIKKFAVEKDSISGFKQGDNGLFQIKANKAQLMEYSTIMNAIQDVLMMRERIFGEQAQDIARQDLLDLFSGQGTMSISKRKARDAISEMARNEIADSLSGGGGGKSSSNSHGNDLSYGGRLGDYI